MRKPCLVAAAMLIAIGAAKADDYIQFVCATEESASAIAAKIITDQASADVAAKPFIDDGTCFYLPGEIRITISYRGKTFGMSNFRVQVIGFKSETDKLFYGLFPTTNEGSI